METRFLNALSLKYSMFPENKSSQRNLNCVGYTLKGFELDEPGSPDRLSRGGTPRSTKEADGQTLCV